MVLVNLAMLAVLVLVTTSPARADGDGFAAHGARGDDSTHSESVDDAARARLVLEGADAERDALALDLRAELLVRGLIAELTLVQRFRNDSDVWRDARYQLPMPEQAVMHGLVVRIGERTIRGEVLEKQAAGTRFAAAREAGQIASLVDVARPNLFTTRIASIPPGETVEMRLNVLLPIDFEDGHYRLVLPTTLVPRYTNSATPDRAAVAALVLPETLIKGPRVTLTTRFVGRDADVLTSPTHSLAQLAPGGDGAAADRDIVLEWLPPAGIDAAAELYVGEQAGVRYVQVLLAAPTGEDGTPAATSEDSSDVPDGTAVQTSTPARELVLVLDRSGSMAGQPIAAARAAIDAALDRLTPVDAFNIIAFDDSVEVFAERSRPANPLEIGRARRFVAGIDADGGTEIAPAFERALATSDPERLTQIVFVTDGAIGYEDALLADIERRIGARRLFTVGIGNAPNRWFMEKAAIAGRGEALFARDATEVEATIGRLLEELATPLLTDLVAGVVGGGMMLYPSPLPDLYAARPVMLVARLEGDVREIVVTGRHGNRRYRRSWALPAVAAHGGESAVSGVDPRPAGYSRWTARESVDTRDDRAGDGIAMVWAAKRIEHLLDRQRVADDPQRHRAEILALALEVGIASPYTSFVAVEEVVSRPAGTDALATAVPNLMPLGNTMRAIALPQGATGLRGTVLLAVLALLSSAGLFASARRYHRSADAR